MLRFRVGLGGAVLVTLAISTVASALVGRIIDALGIDKAGWGGILLRIAAFTIAVLADFLLLLYVLTLLPGVEPTRRRLTIRPASTRLPRARFTVMRAQP